MSKDGLYTSPDEARKIFEHRLFTLNDARTELNRRRCASQGHSYDIIANVTGPTNVICDNCGETWKITPNA